MMLYLCYCYVQVIDETLRIPGTISAVSKEAPIGGTTLSQYHIPAGTPMIVGLKINFQHQSLVIYSFW